MNGFLFNIRDGVLKNRRELPHHHMTILYNDKRYSISFTNTRSVVDDETSSINLNRFVVEMPTSEFPDIQFIIILDRELFIAMIEIRDNEIERMVKRMEVMEYKMKNMISAFKSMNE